MVEFLCNHLRDHPHLYLDEMATILQRKFRVSVKPSTISRALSDKGWSNKVIQQISNRRSADLRDFYLYNLSQYWSLQVGQPRCFGPVNGLASHDALAIQVNLPST
jgi:hypothetical protein